LELLEVLAILLLEYQEIHLVVVVLEEALVVVRLAKQNVVVNIKVVKIHSVDGKHVVKLVLYVQVLVIVQMTLLL
jgi:hypothetical protein